MKRRQGNKRETKVGSLFPFHLHGEGGEDMAHGMFEMRCKFKFETHFLCMDSLKSITWGKWGTHDTLQTQ